MVNIHQQKFGLHKINISKKATAIKNERLANTEILLAVVYW